MGFERLLSDQEVMETSPQGSREISINIKVKTDNNHMHIHTKVVNHRMLCHCYSYLCSLTLSIFLPSDGGSCAG